MNNKVIEWIENNEATIKDICKLYLNDKMALYTLYDTEYHSDIQKQYNERVLSLVCDAVCKDVGCSAEDFYETIEGKEEVWMTLYSSD